MIIPHCFFLILAILPTITEQAQKYSSKNSKLDWSKCGTETKCLCKEDQSSSLEFVQPVEKEPEPLPPGDTADKCDIGIQSKFFTQQTAVIQLQVLGNANYPVAGTTLMLHQGAIKLFGCEFGKIGEPPKVVGDTNKIESSRVGLFEERSQCTKGSCLCALTIGRANKLIPEVSDNDYQTFMNQPTNIILSINNQPEEYETTATGSELYQLKRTTCDPYSFKDDTNSPEYITFHILPLINKDQTIFNCESYGTPEIRYKMKYEKTEDNNEDKKGDMKRLECVRENPNDNLNFNYVFSMVEDVENEVTHVMEEKPKIIANPESYTFFCAAEIDRICENPNPDCDPSKDPKCPIFTKGTKDAAATLKCADDKWLIDDEYYVLEEQVVCKKDAISGQNVVLFFITPPSGVERKVPDVTKAQCFTEYDCLKKSKPRFVGCDEDDKESCPFEYNSQTIKCKNETIDLRVLTATMNETARSLTCDPATGAWKNTTGGAQEPIGVNPQVTCFEEKTDYVQYLEAEMSTSKVTWIVVGTLIGFIAFFTLIIVAILCYKRRKRLFGNTGKEGWLRMSKADQISHCKQTLADVMKATTAIEFKHGLRLLEIILDTENADIEIWEEMYAFLSRLVATLTRQDHHCWHLFTRFCYLRAKKIIDKHGWLTKKPIGKTNQTGLIRVVAIRLLGLCLSDPCNPDTEKLIEKGFRKLGFKGRQQYPHCGVMWATVLHIHPNGAVRKGTRAERAFDYDKFAATLRKIAFRSKSVKPDDIIPAFGSCSQQAAYALGGWWKLSYHTEHGKNLVLRKDVEGGIISMSYFLGACDSLTRNPAQFLVEMCKMQNPNSDMLAKMHAVTSEAEWNEKVTRLYRIVTHLGRHMDTKMLERRFMRSATATDKTGKPDQDAPTNQPPKANEYLTELYTEQEDFEKALDEQLEDLRDFFIQYVDKKELKVKPVYNTSGKLDSRVNTGNAKDVLAGPNAKSCGGSDKSASDTKSDTKVGVPGPGSNPGSNPQPNSAPEPGAPTPPPVAATPISEPATPGESPAAAAKGPPSSEPPAP